MPELISQELIEQKIFVIRGEKVMLDRDLAKLYGVMTSQLTRQVRRNIDRFPADFMFQLTRKRRKAPCSVRCLLSNRACFSNGDMRRLPERQ